MPIENIQTQKEFIWTFCVVLVDVDGTKCNKGGFLGFVYTARAPLDPAVSEIFVRSLVITNSVNHFMHFIGEYHRRLCSDLYQDGSWVVHMN